MASFAKFEKITIQWIALSGFRTTAASFDLVEENVNVNRCLILD